MSHCGTKQIRLRWHDRFLLYRGRAIVPPRPVASRCSTALSAAAMPGQKCLRRMSVVASCTVCIKLGAVMAPRAAVARLFGTRTTFSRHLWPPRRRVTGKMCKNVQKSLIHGVSDPKCVFLGTERVKKYGEDSQ